MENEGDEYFFAYQEEYPYEEYVDGIYQPYKQYIDKYYVMLRKMQSQQQEIQQGENNMTEHKRHIGDPFFTEVPAETEADNKVQAVDYDPQDVIADKEVSEDVEEDATVSKDPWDDIGEADLGDYILGGNKYSDDEDFEEGERNNMSDAAEEVSNSFPEEDVSDAIEGEGEQGYPIISEGDSSYEILVNAVMTHVRNGAKISGLYNFIISEAEQQLPGVSALIIDDAQELADDSQVMADRFEIDREFIGLNPDLPNPFQRLVRSASTLAGLLEEFVEDQ